MNDEITREQDETTLEQGGFDAISEKLHALYPGQEGRFYGTVIPYFLGGNDPLDGVEVWKRRGNPSLALCDLRLYRAVPEGVRGPGGERIWL